MRNNLYGDVTKSYRMNTEIDIDRIKPIVYLNVSQKQLERISIRTSYK